MSRLRKLTRRMLSQSPAGLKILLRLRKLTLGEYYDMMGEFVMQRALKVNSNCIDVGCHRGDVLEPMLRFAPHGKFWAFEPLPNLFEYLESRFNADKRITLSNLALSDTEGIQSFQYVVDAPAYSGFRMTNAISMNSSNVRTIDVRTAKLDDVLQGTDVDLIKIDVEGAELQVLRGGVEMLRRCQPYVLFEHADHAKSYGTSSEDIFDLVNEECGLRISLLDGFLSGKRPMTRREFVDSAKSQFYFLAHRPHGE